MYIKIIKLDKVDSTNDYASRVALSGGKEITIISADSQLSGKGRMGRSWVSVPGKGIYVSFLIKPQNSLKEINYLPLFSALATARFLEGAVAQAQKEHKVKIKIKLPNDIIVNGKKVAGILVEAKTTGKKTNFVIIGIGVNMNSLKEELPDHATSLFVETGHKYDVKKNFPKLIKEMMTVYKDFKKGRIKPLLNELLPFGAGSSVEEIEEKFDRKKETGEVVHFV